MLTEKELSTLTEIINQLYKVNENIAEFSDLWLSDIQNLCTMEVRLHDIVRDHRAKESIEKAASALHSTVQGNNRTVECAEDKD